MQATQRIEIPSQADRDLLARQLAHADDLVAGVTGSSLTGRLSDLALMQRVLDAKQVEPEATWSLQALGIAFGRVFLANAEHYDWWMVEDEFGRDPAVRYKETSLLAFPQTMISKRIEDGEAIDLQEFHAQLVDQLETIRARNFSHD